MTIHPITSIADCKARERTIECQMFDAATKAFAAADACALFGAIGRMQDRPHVARRAIRHIVRSDIDPSQDSRLAWVEAHIEQGEVIRDALDGADLLFLDAARKLFPRYDGPALTLYRGEPDQGRGRRYGFCWTDDIEIGRAFARDAGLRGWCHPRR